MDVRLTAEQQQLRDASAKLADDLGPGSVQDLGDADRIARLDKQIQITGWRSLRSDEASAVVRSMRAGTAALCGWMARPCRPSTWVQTSMPST